MTRVNERGRTSGKKYNMEIEYACGCAQAQKTTQVIHEKRILHVKRKKNGANAIFLQTISHMVVVLAQPMRLRR